jgi:DNA-binding CsgD family transcriptional regulator/PAS domain-containing protein
VIHFGVDDRSLDLCYDAIFDDRLWQHALDSLAAAFSAEACSFVAQGSPDLRRRLPASSAYQNFLIDFIGEGWSRNDHRAQRGWPRLTKGGVVLTEHDVSTEQERKTLNAYRDLYARHDLMWWSTVSFDVGADMWAMSFLRSAASEPFEPVEVPVLRSLAPQLSRLINLKSKMLAAEASDAVGLLESTVQAAIVVDEHGKVLAINPPAERLLGQTLQIRAGRLGAYTRADNDRLMELIRAGVSRSERTMLRPPIPGPLTIQRDGAARLVIDIANDYRLFGRLFGGRCVLLLTDLHSPTVAPVERLRVVFHLTAAEGRLAHHLGLGAPLSEAAEILGISRETARSQLKAIFAKTDTNGQAALARLLSALARISV